jgi:hypothetical protein
MGEDKDAGQILAIRRPGTAGQLNGRLHVVKRHMTRHYNDHNTFPKHEVDHYDS